MQLKDKILNKEMIKTKKEIRRPLRTVFSFEVFETQMTWVASDKENLSNLLVWILDRSAKPKSLKNKNKTHFKSVNEDLGDTNDRWKQFYIPWYAHEEALQAPSRRRPVVEKYLIYAIKWIEEKDLMAMNDFNSFTNEDLAK
jgi:hypothetical protein